MEELNCNLSPVVYAELYRLLAENEAFRDPLENQLSEIHLPHDWLLDASASYRAKWEHDLEYTTPETLSGLALEPSHAELATWLLSGLALRGDPGELESALQSSVMEIALDAVPSLGLPLPPELSPVIRAWTLGRAISTHGNEMPVYPAVAPADENARLAFEGLIEHYLVLEDLAQPWPEMMCTSLYWRGYGIAEALKPYEGTGGRALNRLSEEGYNYVTGQTRARISGHVSMFAPRRNTLSHVANDESRAGFSDVVLVTTSEEDTTKSLEMISQFVFQEVAKQLRERRPKAINRGVWDRLELDIRTEW